MDIYIKIDLVLIGLGLIFTIVAALVYKHKFSGIKHYEGIRDKVTIRELKEKKSIRLPEPNFIVSFIGIIISLVIGIILIIIVQNQVNIIESVNTTGFFIDTTTKSMLELTPGLFVVFSASLILKFFGDDVG